MKLTAKSIVSAALIATTLLSPAQAQAQASGITEFKLRVDSTLVLGTAASTGKLRVLNSGPATTEVRWFDPKVGAWSSQDLGVGQSLLSQRGKTLTISSGTLVCLVGKAADTKDKGGYRMTKGYLSMPATPEQKETKKQDKQKTKPKTGKGGAAKEKPKAQQKPAPKQKPKAGQKPKAEQKPGATKAKQKTAQSGQTICTKGGAKQKPGVAKAKQKTAQPSQTICTKQGAKGSVKPAMKK